MIHFLNWDSEFFKKKIGYINYEKNLDIQEVINEAKESEYNLLYVFSKEDIPERLLFVHDVIGKKVDRKVEYSIDLSSDFDFKCSIVEDYKSTELVPELEELAYQSGQFSRFKLDRSFDSQDFYRLYYTWIKRSVSKEIADNIFITRNDMGVIKSMVTVKFNILTSHIGLISVDSDSQGKGFGKAIINKCIMSAKEFGSKKLNVATQFENKNARVFYEKCGFSVENETNVYHFWL